MSPSCASSPLVAPRRRRRLPLPALLAALALTSAPLAAASESTAAVASAALSPFDAPANCIGTVAGSAPVAPSPGQRCPNDGASIVAAASSGAASGVLYAVAVTFASTPAGWQWRGQVRATALDGSCVIVAGTDAFLPVPEGGASGTPVSDAPACAFGSTPLPAAGYDARTVCLRWPAGLAVDPVSGDVLIAEAFGHRVLRLSATTGRLSTFAGTGAAGYAGDGGPAVTAQLFKPTAVAADASEPGAFFIADAWNSVVRRVSARGVIATVAGSEPVGAGMASAYYTYYAPFPANGPTGFGCLWRPAAFNTDWWGLPSGGGVLDGYGNTLTDPASGLPLSPPAAFGDAGSGPGLSACLQSLSQFHIPSLAGTPDGGFVYADSGNNRVLRFTPVPAPAPGGGGRAYNFTTIAGSAAQWQDVISTYSYTSGAPPFAGGLWGSFSPGFMSCWPAVGAAVVPFFTPGGLSSFPANVFPACDDNATAPAATAACFCSPRGVAVEASGAVIVTDFDTRALARVLQGDASAAATRVRRIHPNGTAVVIPTPPGALAWVQQSTITSLYGDIYAADVGLLSGNASAGVSVLTATGASADAATFAATTLLVPAGFSGNLIALPAAGSSAALVTTVGSAGGGGSGSGGSGSGGSGAGGAGGAGVPAAAAAAAIAQPAVALFSTGATLYSGDGGPAFGAALNAPLALSFGPPSSANLPFSAPLYVADTGNNRVRVVAADGSISTLAGGDAGGVCNASSSYTGPAVGACLSAPVAVAASPTTGDVYISDALGVRVHNATTRRLTTLVPGWAAVTSLLVSPNGRLLFIASAAPQDPVTLLAAPGGHGIYRLATGAPPGTAPTRVAGLPSGLACVPDAGATTDVAQPTCGPDPASGGAYERTCGDLANYYVGSCVVNASGVSTCPLVPAGTVETATAAGETVDALTSCVNAPAGLAAVPDPYASAGSGALRVAFLDTNSNRVRLLWKPTGSAGWAVVTLVGAGAYGGYNPVGYAGASVANAQSNAVDLSLEVKSGMAYVDGGLVFGDYYNDVVRFITPVDRTADVPLVTLAGTGGEQGYTGDDGAASLATLTAPAGVAADAYGNVYIADQGARVVRAVVRAELFACPVGAACPCARPRACAEPAGYCPGNVARPVPTIDGFFSALAPVNAPGAGAYTSPAVCPAGAFCASGVKTPCPPGTVGLRPRQALLTACFACPAGTYSAELGAAAGSCVPCPELSTDKAALDGAARPNFCAWRLVNAGAAANSTCGEDSFSVPGPFGGCQPLGEGHVTLASATSLTVEVPPIAFPIDLGDSWEKQVRTFGTVWAAIASPALLGVLAAVLWAFCGGRGRWCTHGRRCGWFTRPVFAIMRAVDQMGDWKLGSTALHGGIGKPVHWEGTPLGRFRVVFILRGVGWR